MLNRRRDDFEDVVLALNECLDFVGNFWPDHDVGEKDMALLLDAYDKLKEAAHAVLRLENHRSGRDGEDASKSREDGS